MARQMSDGAASVDDVRAISPSALRVPRPTVAAEATYAPLTILAIMLAGCLVRVAAAEHLTPHGDEAASVLAAHAVAERGVPVLPSGTVYFQGATLSYLLAPFVWLGFGDLHDLAIMRGVSVVAGTIAVFLAYRLGVAVARDERVGMLAALFVAMDPLSVQWSGHVRMYGLLQALTLAFVWLLLRAVRAPSLAVLVGLVVTFWAAVFTHIEVALLWPGLILTATISWSSLPHRSRWRWVASAGLTVIAPVALVALNDLLGSASVNTGTTPAPPKVSFVGDHLVAPLALVRNLYQDFDPSVVLRMSNATWLVPGVLVALGTLVAAWCWRRVGGGQSYQCQRAVIAVLLVCYWVPIIGVALFSISFKERYLLHVHLIGYVLLATVIVHLGSSIGTPGRRRAGRIAMVRSVSLAGTMIGMLAVGLVWRFAYPVVHADHIAATEYVVAHRQRHEPVIVALPAVAGLLMADQEDLYFLAGSETQSRAERPTRVSPDGLVDYWLGVPAIVTASTLETLLRDHPGAWVVVDRDRLGADWAYRGEIAATFERWTKPEYEAAGGALVFRVPPGHLSEQSMPASSGRGPPDTRREAG